MSSTKISRRTKTILVFQGDDLDKLEELAARCGELLEREGEASANVMEAAETYDQLLAEAKERAVSVTLTDLGHRRWRNLLREHPARTDHAGDKTIGANVDTIFEALLKASITQPEFASDGDREDFLDSLTDAVHDKLAVAAFGLNRISGNPTPIADLIARGD